MRTNIGIGLARSDAGNIALLFALLLPVLLGAVGAGVDFGRYSLLRAELQEIADAAAIAGAREFLLSTSGGSLAAARGEQAALSGVARSGGGAAAKVDAKADNAAKSVTVALSVEFRPTLFVALVKTPIDLAVDATASATGGANICVIGLNRVDGDVVAIDDNAKLDGADCAVYSNSADPHGMLVKASAKLKSRFNCTAGGYGDKDHHFSPTPLTDCPPREDPLADRAPPSVGGCDHQNKTLKDYAGRLSPGVYCGGLTIDGASVVNLDPGVYVIKDGPLQVKDTSRFSGEGAGFYFTGIDARLLFEDKVVVSLAAPQTGAMAGVLFWQSPTATGIDRFEVKSNFVDRLVGTIYLPSAEFYAFASDEIAENSEYTAIIADRVQLAGKTTLVLNANYALTSVPVPAGLAGAGGQIFLRE